LFLLDERDPAVPGGAQRQRQTGHAAAENQGVVPLSDPGPLSRRITALLPIT
jgi:hypothetical protein